VILKYHVHKLLQIKPLQKAIDGRLAIDAALASGGPGKGNAPGLALSYDNLFGSNLNTAAVGKYQYCLRVLFMGVKPINKVGVDCQIADQWMALGERPGPFVHFFGPSGGEDLAVGAGFKRLGAGGINCAGGM
jgi:hypothetical protein